MPERKLPSDEVLRRWREDEGLTLKQIHERLREQGVDVAFSAVSVALGRMGATKRIRYDDWLPWPLIHTEHNQAWEASMLRTGARISRGLPVTPKMQRLFDMWMDDLKDNNLVVAYKPDRGFFYTKPRRQDGKGGIPVRKPPRDPSTQPDADVP